MHRCQIVGVPTRFWSLNITALTPHSKAVKEFAIPIISYMFSPPTADCCPVQTSRPTMYAINATIGTACQWILQSYSLMSTKNWICRFTPHDGHKSHHIPPLARGVRVGSIKALKRVPIKWNRFARSTISSSINLGKTLCDEHWSKISLSYTWEIESE